MKLKKNDKYFFNTFLFKFQVLYLAGTILHERELANIKQHKKGEDSSIQKQK